MDAFWTLFLTAIFLGVFHTLIAPDHYLPFVALSKDRNWSLPHTLGVTFLCGFGHVFSSILVGVVGILLGAGVASIEGLDEYRSDVVKWIMLAFGLSYLAYGLYRSYKGGHGHSCACGSAHNKLLGGASFWVLFFIFTFGPCEILIPLLIYPASEFNWIAVIAVALAFSLSSVATMLLSVASILFGLRLAGVWTDSMGRWSQAVTGAVITACSIFMFTEGH